jgi:hypothetical protein
VTDTTPPRTTIESKPRVPGRGHSVFRIASSEPGSTFECKLDDRPFRPCGERIDYPNLKPGRHRFQARATDQAGNTDPTPAKTGFRVRG